MEKSKLPDKIPFEPEELSLSLVDRFTKVRRVLPAGHLAYHDPYTDLSYEQLFEASEHLAAALAAAFRPELAREQQLVGLFLDADWMEIVGLLGVNLSGHYYMAFDTLQGLAHLEAAFKEFPIKALVTVTRHIEVAKSLAQLAPYEVAVLCVDDLPEAPADFPHPDLSPATLHSIGLTTGSTGKPRGVLRSHSSRVAASYHEDKSYNFGLSDRVALTMPLAIPMSLAASQTTLLTGGSIHRRLEALSNPAALYRWLVDEQITILHGSGGLMRSLASLPAEYGPIESLRHIRTGGEPLSHADIDRLLRFIPPGGTYSGRLASNEAGTFGIFTTQAGQAWVGDFNPAGSVPPYVEVTVVDENRQPLPFGEIGELVVRSQLLAVGYFNDPTQTAARFVPANDGSGDLSYYTGDMGLVFADRRIEFIGRKDFRVKVRGYTIELEAVERAMRKLEHVRDAAATVQVLPNGNKRIVGFLVMEDGFELSVRQVREQLGKDLLQYMIPSVLQGIDSIPRIGIGKIDRKALPTPAPQRSNLNVPYRAPRSELEVKLAQIWESVLGVQPVGVDDSFFDLGGDSLLSMQMNMEVEKQFNFPIPAGYYKHPTIANLVETLENKAGSSQVETPDGSTRAKETTPLPVGLRRFQQLGRLTPERIFGLLRRQIEKNMLLRTYDQGLAWLLEWTGRPATQNMLYFREKNLYKALWKDLGLAPGSFEESFRLVLAGNIISDHLISALHRQKERGNLKRFADSPYLFWRSFGEILDQPGSTRARQFVEISGQANLQAARDQGQGVLILSYHGTLTRLPMLLIPYLLGKPAALVLSPRISMQEETVPTPYRLRDYSTIPENKQAQYSADIIMQGYRALQGKEVVAAFVDNGYTSRGDWPIAVSGRRYMTRTGWADLAIRTGAQIVPMMASLSKEGQVSIEFLPAFKNPSGTADHETRLQAYMNQFAEYFGSVIAEHPEALLWRVMRSHLEMPLVEKTGSKPA